MDQKLPLAMNDLIENLQDTFHKIMQDESDQLHVTVHDLLELWLDFTRRTLADATELADAQMLYWQDYLLLCKDLMQRLNDSILSRLHQVDTRERILSSFLDKFTFLISQHVYLVIKTIFQEQEGCDKKIVLYTRQFTEAFTQHHYVTTHAEALYEKVMREMAAD